MATICKDIGEVCSTITLGFIYYHQRDALRVLHYAIAFLIADGQAILLETHSINSKSLDKRLYRMTGSMPRHLTL